MPAFLFPTPQRRLKARPAQRLLRPECLARHLARRLPLVLLGWALAGCGDEPTQPTAPAVETTSAVQAAPDARARGAASPDIELKFREALRVRLVAGEVRGAAGQSIETIKRTLAAHANPPLRPLITLRAERLEELTREARARSSRTPPDLGSWYRVQAVDAADATRLVAALNALPEVDTAYSAPTPAPPPGSTVPRVPSLLAPRTANLTTVFTTNMSSATADLSPEQGYFGPAPSGTEATFARLQPGGRGEGIKVIDLEYDWDLSHEDLGLGSEILLGGEPFALFGKDHGTAVLGELVAGDNGFGVTGGVPDATIRVVSPVFAGNYIPADAITIAANDMAAGDVLLIEQQADGPSDGGTDYVPLEWIPSVYDAILLTTEAGKVVVEPAGNGGKNLDGPEFRGAFDRGVRHSGAIIVGAGDTGHQALDFSCYGSRVDLQGWGAGVTTTGYGDLSGTGPSDSYTGNFSGTSSASPIVAAAAAAVEGHAKATQNRFFGPRELATVLKQTGTPQTGDLSRQIGPFPDLGAALGEAPTDNPPVAAAGGPYSGNEGAGIWFSSAGSSDPEGDALSYRWNFGDSTTSTAANPTKAYADDGTYTVTLSVSSEGLEATATTTATISNVAPRATLTAPSSILEGSGYMLSLTNVTDSGTVDRATLQYALNCGQGAGYTAWSGTVKSVACPKVPDQRALTVRGKVRDKDGGSREYSRPLTVTNAAPVVKFAATSPTTFRAGGMLSVQGSFTDRGMRDAPWTYTLVWGDGAANKTGMFSSQGAAITASHRYVSAGTRSVFMTVKDKDGTVGTSAKLTATVSR